MMNAPFSLRMTLAAALLFAAAVHAENAPPAAGVITDVRDDDGVWTCTETFRPTLALDGTLSISNENGSIDVVPSEDGALLIVAQKTVKPRPQALQWLRGERKNKTGGREVLEELAIAVSGDATRLELSTAHVPESSGFQASVNYKVYVPKGISVNLDNVNGDVTSAGLENDLDARTENGTIQLDKMSGKVIAHATNGSIDVGGRGGKLEAATVNGEIICRYTDAMPDDATIKCSSTNGGINFSASPESAFALRATTTNGTIHSGIPLTGTVRPKNVDAVAGTGGAAITLTTTNGDISVGNL